MLDQAADSKLFEDADWCKRHGLKLQGNVYAGRGRRMLPLYEAKMVQAFDHRASSVLESEDNNIRTGEKDATKPVQHADPEFAVLPRWWVSADAVAAVMGQRVAPYYLCYKRITSATNERTVIASFIPGVAVAHPAPLLLLASDIAPARRCCLLANLNAFALDFVARQKVGSTDLDYFVIRQLPVLPPDAYADKCPWSKRETLEHWIRERVLKLSCTANDMIPLAEACGFKGSTGRGVHIWKESERPELRAELDAAYFHLYAVEREDAAYMLSTFNHTGHVPPDLRERDGAEWDKGSIGELILDAYDWQAAHM